MNKSKSAFWLVGAFTTGVILGMYYGGSLLSLNTGEYEPGFWVGIIAGIILGVLVGAFVMLKIIGRINHKA